MKPPIRPPEYGSPEWQALAVDDPLRRESVLFAADSWRLLCSSPHVDDLLFEWVEWLRRLTLREASWRVSSAVEWSSVASGPTYAELASRRLVFAEPPLSPEEIRAKCAASWARFEVRNSESGAGSAAA